MPRRKGRQTGGSARRMESPMTAQWFASLALCPALLFSASAFAADAPETWSHGPRGPYAVERVLPPPPSQYSVETIVPRRPPLEEAEVCRVIVRRHVDEFGEVAVRRVRICEEEPTGYRRPGWSAAPIPPRNVGRLP